jgi:hypothetical protein
MGKQDGKVKAKDLELECPPDYDPQVMEKQDK